MTSPSPNRKYYIVPVTTDPELGGWIPDVDFPAWTARYLSDSVCLIRDPDGLRSYPVLGVDVTIDNALSSLPIELSLSMTQQDADDTCDYLGLARVDLAALAEDRIEGR